MHTKMMVALGALLAISLTPSALAADYQVLKDINFECIVVHNAYYCPDNETDDRVRERLYGILGPVARIAYAHIEGVTTWDDEFEAWVVGAPAAVDAYLNGGCMSTPPVYPNGLFYDMETCRPALLG